MMHQAANSSMLNKEHRYGLLNGLLTFSCSCSPTPLEIDMRRAQQQQQQIADGVQSEWLLEWIYTQHTGPLNLSKANGMSAVHAATGKSMNDVMNMLLAKQSANGNDSDTGLLVDAHGVRACTCQQMPTTHRP
jgi:hypothetical protein